MGIEEKLPSGFLLTTVEQAAGWVRKSSVFPATFGLACCAIEMMTTGAGRYDLARFGMEVFRGSPRQADLMIVAGPGQPEDGAGAAAGLRPDAEPQVGHLHGRLRLLGRHVQQLRDRAGRRPHRPRRHLSARLPAAPRDAAGRDPQAPPEDPELKLGVNREEAAREAEEAALKALPTIEMKGLLR